jgi:hypothetical protein
MKKLSWLFVMAIFAYACQTDDIVSMEENASGKINRNAASVGAVVHNDGPGGNAECGEGYELTSGRINYENGAFDGEWPEGFTVTTDGTNVSWSYEDPNGVLCIKNMQVIVKGGPNSHIYTYTEGVQGDEGLTAPINTSGKRARPYGLSNLTFCYNLEPCEDTPEVCYDDETAWAAGTRYENPGNWATFTAYDGSANTVTLFAGRTIAIGTVTFGEVDESSVEITISLGANANFQDVAENVKIQDYASAPSGNPAIGNFAHKGNATGKTFSISVPANNFYGVHVDAAVETTCPTDND